MITELTPEQQATLSVFRQEWFRWGTSTERADRSRAEAAILAMRVKIGVAKHPTFIWCESPATSLLVLNVLKGKEKNDSLRDSLWDSLGDSLRDSLWDSLGDSLWDSLWASLGDSLGEAAGWGQHDSYWIAFYLFCRDKLGVNYSSERSAELDLWGDIAQSCCWWWCYENYVIVSERPVRVSMDEREVLHCADGPALAFSDGWAVHSWHGTRVPAEWIEDRVSLTGAIALAEQNVERRRAACEIIGWDRVLSELKARVIDRDDDPEIGELLEVDLPDAPKTKFLRVLCGTGRRFCLPVAPEYRTALAANAATYRIPPELLRLKGGRT